jgi:hypothetical protein
MAGLLIFPLAAVLWLLICDMIGIDVRDEIEIDRLAARGIDGRGR